MNDCTMMFSDVTWDHGVPRAPANRKNLDQYGSPDTGIPLVHRE